MASSGPQIGHPLDYPGGVWKCPKTGVVVAKTLQANIEQRRAFIQRAEVDPAYRAAMNHLFARSALLWINLCAFTFVVIEQHAAGRRINRGSPHKPFITWPVQDACIEAIETAMHDGTSLAITKAREMGASWILLAKGLHCALYNAQSNWLLGSRREDLVDAAGDMDSLLPKIDYMLKFLPTWMVPVPGRKHLEVTFPELGTRIDGESTNANLGRAGRRTLIAIDEAASVPDLRAIDNSTQDSTATRIYLSTPKRGSYFAMVLRSKKMPVFRMHWWDHPEKGVGRRLVKDPTTGEMRFTSPWYEAEVAKRVDAQDIRENLDVDDEGGAAAVFDSKTITVQLASYGADPAYRGDVVMPRGIIIDPDLDLAERPMHLAHWLDKPAGRLRWWGEMLPTAGGHWRPKPGRPYALGVDVSQGVGASDSVIVFIDAETGWIVGRWSSNMVMPGELADALYMLGHWIANGADMPFIAVEANGPGGAVLKRLRRLGYGALYSQRDESKRSKANKPTLGWTSNRTSKRDLLELFRGALARHDCKCPDREILEQAVNYTNYEEGGVGPLTSSGMTEEQRAQHGDLVIGAMLAWEAAQHMPAMEELKPDPPPGSFGWRRQQREAKTRQMDDDLPSDD